MNTKPTIVVEIFKEQFFVILDVHGAWSFVFVRFEFPNFGIGSSQNHNENCDRLHHFETMLTHYFLVGAAQLSSKVIEEVSFVW